VEIYERIRELRKNHLNMTQEAFAEKLGVSRSVIKNIELNALARPEQKLSLIKLMCKEFSVNEKWLLDGTEPMFVEPDSFSLDKFVRDHEASDLELQVLKAYFELDSSVRRGLIDYFRRHLSEPTDPDTPEELESRFAPIEDNTQAG